MKKLLTVLLALALTLSLCSCSLFRKIDAAYLYTKAAKTLSEAESFEMECNIILGMSILGFNMDMDFAIDMKAVGESSQMEMTVLGQDMTVTMIDDYVYTDVLGSSVRYTVPENGEDVTDDFVVAQLPEMAEEILKATEVIENEDGTKSLELSLSSEQAQNLMGMAGDMYADMKFDSIILTLNFDEDNVISSMTMSGEYTASEEGLQLGGEVSATYTFLSFNEDLEITLPNPPEDYTDGGVYEGNGIV